EGVARERTTVLRNVRHGPPRATDFRARRILQREAEQDVAGGTFDSDIGEILRLIPVLVGVRLVAWDLSVRICIFARAVELRRVPQLVLVGEDGPAAEHVHDAGEVAGLRIDPAAVPDALFNAGNQAARGV